MGRCAQVTMKLLKTSVLSSFVSIGRMLAGTIIHKLIAVLFGPAGIAVLGQVQNFTLASYTFSGAHLQTGVIKNISEQRSDPDKVQSILSVALRLYLGSAALVAVFVFAFSGPLSQWLFASLAYKSVLQIFAVALVFGSLNNYLLALLNGLQKIPAYVGGQLATILVHAILVTILTMHWHLYGAVLAYSVLQVFGFLICWGFCRRLSIPLFPGLFKSLQDNSYLKPLLQYGVMGIVGGISQPLVYLILRHYIINHISWDAAGYWQAMVKVSDTYLSVFTTTLVVYYLPRYAELNTPQELRSEISLAYKSLPVYS